METTSKGLAINHGFWPLSPDSTAKSSKTVAKKKEATNRATKRVKSWNPSLTQLWQAARTHQKPGCDRDVERAFLVLEGNVPRTKYYGSKDTKVKKADHKPRSSSLQNSKSPGQRRYRSRSSSPLPRWARSRNSNQQFSRDTISSAVKYATSEPYVYHHSSGEDVSRRLKKQLELEKIYKKSYTIPGKSAKFNRKGDSGVHSARSSGSAVLKKQKTLAVESRKSKSGVHSRDIVSNKNEGKSEASVLTDDLALTDDKIPELKKNNRPAKESNHANKRPASTKTLIKSDRDAHSTGNEKTTEKDVDTKHLLKNSTDSEFEISTMPQPTLNRARFRDKSPYRQPSGKNNHQDNNSNSSHNNNFFQTQHRDSAKRRKGAKDSEESLLDNALEINFMDSVTVKRELTEVEIVSNEEKLESYLKECLTECSRQRLRAIHMSMRRLGNVESRISMKDLHQAFQENSVKLSSRVFSLITETFVDHLGIDYERLHRSMMRAQLLTRRDSVEAMLSQNNEESLPDIPREESDADYLHRLEEQLVLDQSFFDLEELQKSFQEKDKSNTGRISKEEVYRSCTDAHIPLYGALLKNLVNHCDGGQPDAVNWHEFMSYLDKSQKSAISKHPEMAALPERAKLKQMASPLDLMDPEKKSRIVKTLLKKVSESRVNVFAANAALAEQETEKTSTETESEPKADDVTVSIENETSDNAQEMASESKKRDSELEETIVEVDQPTDLTVDETSLQNDLENVNPLDAPTDIFVTLRIKGKDVTLRKPAGYNVENASVDLPTESLELDWVYGYRGNDCRSNLYVLASGEIVYFTASIAILYDRDAHSQRHYQEHTERIKSMAVHSDGVTIATGQVDSKTESSSEAHVRVWRSDNLETLHVLGIGIFEKSVMCLSFPKIKRPPTPPVEDTDDVKLFNPKDQLIAIDNGPEKNVTVWDASSGEMVAKETLEAEVICDVEFNPKYPDTFVTIGKEHIAWWKVNGETGSLLLSQQPVFDNYMKAKFVVCLTHNNQGDLITGDSNGTVYIWADGGNKITNFIKHAHDGPVFSLLLHKNVLLTGGRDSVVKSWQWGKTMEPLQTCEIPKTDGGIRTLVAHRNSLLMGTTTNAILSGEMSQGSCALEKMKLDDIPITQGHYGDCRGLTVTGDGKQRGHFLTTALDGIICVFSAEKHEPVWKLVLKGTPFHTVDACPAGNLLAFGTKDGNLLILNVLEDHSFKEQFRHRITKEKVTCVKISPDTNLVAAGCADRAVCIYRKQVKDDGMVLWELQGKCRGHHGSISSIDWSSEMSDDSYFLRTSSTTPEQLFWKVKSLEKIDNVDDIQHICWASNLCTLDLSTVGLWSSTQADEGEVNGVDVNPAKTLVAMGDSSGYVSLFKYPSCRQGAFSHTYKAHQSVHALRFVGDGKYLVSLGGADSCIIQWKVV